MIDAGSANLQVQEMIVIKNAEIEQLRAELAEAKAELEKAERGIIDGVIALITTEQKAMCNLYTQYAYGINKVCNRLKLFVGEITKQPPTNQEPDK